MSSKYVTDEDQKKYGAFCRHHFAEIVRKRPILPLIHYTRGSNLINIINTGKLWSTQASCLNDEKELVHSVEMLREATIEKLATLKEGDFSDLLKKMIDRLTQPTPEVAGFFVSCFSDIEDDLSQWRAYGGTDGGYAIKLDPEKIIEYVSQNGAYLAPVLYKDTDKKALMDDILKWTEIFFNDGIRNNRAPSIAEWAEDFLNQWLWNLGYLAPLIKHESFDREAEWRVILWLKPEDTKNLCFQERSTMMTRHLPLQFSEPNHEGYTPLPITEIMVGPKAHKEVSKISVEDLLFSKGYDSSIKVTITKIPFRSSH